MGSPPPDFLWDHPRTPPFHLCYPPFYSLLPSSTFTPSWPQFSPIGLCSSLRPPSSPRGTSQLLSTPPQVSEVSFQWYLKPCYK